MAFPIGPLITAGGSIASAFIGSSSASKSQDKATKVARDQLNFAIKRYEDWENTWGSLEDSLAEFARSYTGAHAQALGLRAVEDTFKQTNIQLKEFNAQRGLSTSGLGAHQSYQLQLGRATERAKAISDAPLQAAKVRADLFSLGQQREGGLLTNRANAAANYSNSLTAGAERSANVGGAISGALTNFLTEGGGSEYLANKFKNLGSKPGVNTRGKISLFEEQGVR